MLKENPKTVVEMILDEYPADMILVNGQRLSTLYPDLAARMKWNYSQFNLLTELAK